MREDKTTVYVTSDNKRFFNKAAAEKHEKRLTNTKVYKVRYEPDLNETGRLSKSGYLIIESLHDHELWAEDWLYKNLGSRVAFVQGSQPVINWSYVTAGRREVNKDVVLAKLIKI